MVRKVYIFKVKREIIVMKPPSCMQSISHSSMIYQQYVVTLTFNLIFIYYLKYKYLLVLH